MASKLLLIDADFFTFSTAIAFQRDNPFDLEGGPIFDEGMAWHTLQGRVDKLMGIFETKQIEMHFSCSRESNWRRGLVPSYKMNRKNKKAPVGLGRLTEMCYNTYPCVDVHALEADDTIGMAATSLKQGKNSVICSVDKDFLTIPTTIWNPVKNILKKQNRVDAFKFFIYQTIIGDTADGFKGIPGCGKVAAQKFLAKHSKNLVNIWKPLVELAAKKKLKESQLLSQARMAHILQDGDYNYETGEIKLWLPEMIEEMLCK